ncbi:DNA-binding transcriptional regulator, AcrR family [Sinosporangium album]|uniref:DNA-binding transcriptional regulator, AcrR family n=1 Tax=Sinosporangium album TaxID=504805 RepID=A0A1G8DL77_9ACTN|nr:DNA-binding transcriptional regulator, AcrR family [Sinosporangium album]
MFVMADGSTGNIGVVVRFGTGVGKASGKSGGRSADRQGADRRVGDRRVRRTRQAVQRALVELILEKGYDAVTVTDIIDRADVGRSTFYAHFTDKRDVLFGNLDELVEMLKAGSGPAPGRLFGFSLPLFEHVGEHRDLVRALLGRRGGGVVVPRVERILTGSVREELLAAVPAGGRPPEGLELVAACVVGALTALLVRWAEDGGTATARGMDAVFREVVTPGVEALLARGAGTPLPEAGGR